MVLRPPFFPSNKYLLNNEIKQNILISREKYVELFEQGFLKKNVICRDLIELKNNSHVKTTNMQEENETPNPDPEIILKNVKEFENGKFEIENSKESFCFEKNLSNFKQNKKKKEIPTYSTWNDFDMEIEDEKNCIKKLSENKFKMKSFLDEKYENSSVIKGK